LSACPSLSWRGSSKSYSTPVVVPVVNDHVTASITTPSTVTVSAANETSHVVLASSAALGAKTICPGPSRTSPSTGCPPHVNAIGSDATISGIAVVSNSTRTRESIPIPSAPASGQ
jgi:hypothetical protein